MVFRGMSQTETFFFHTDGDVHYIEMERDGEEGIFYVKACCNDEWEWKFYDTASNYELVKHMIIDVAFSEDDMVDAMDALDGVFEDIFGEIVVWDECDCDGNCQHCGCK